MAVSAIAGSITLGVGIPYIEGALWKQPLSVLRGWGYPRELVEQVLKLPVGVRWAIAAEISYGLAADEEGEVA